MNNADHTARRDYTLNSLKYVVNVPIKGGTDYYTEAAFERYGDAKTWADVLNNRHDRPNGPYGAGMAYIKYVGNRCGFVPHRAK